MFHSLFSNHDIFIHDLYTTHLNIASFCPAIHSSSLCTLATCLVKVLYSHHPYRPSTQELEFFPGYSFQCGPSSFQRLVCTLFSED